MPHDRSCPVCGGRIDGVPLTIVPDRGIVVANGRFATLTGKEMLVLEALAERFPNVLTTGAIMDAVYSGRDEPEQKIVDVFICKIRKKVAPLGVRIDTAWGKGYALAVEHRPLIATQSR